MSEALFREGHLKDIGDAIREQLQVETLYLPVQMPAAIRSITARHASPSFTPNAPGDAVLIDESHMSAIGDAIRLKLGVSTLYQPGQMAAAIRSIGPATHALVAVNVTAMPTRTSYEVGDALDLTGLQITASYDDGQTADVTAFCVFAPPAGDIFMASGIYTITASYTEDEVTKTTSFGVSVVAQEITLSAIAVTALPDKVHYAAGEVIDYTGLVVTATYSDSSTANVTIACAIFPAAGDVLLSVGPHTVTVSYTYGETTQTASFVVSVAGTGNATRLFLELPDAATKKINFKPYGSAATIDWGDGSTPESVPTTSETISHDYTVAGGYVVSISGTIKNLGSPVGLLNVLNLSLAKSGTSPELTAVELGDVMNVCVQCFQSCTSLTEFKVPASVDRLWQNAVNKAILLTKAELGARQIDGYAMSGAQALEKVWIRSTAAALNVEVNGSDPSIVYGPFNGCPSTTVLYCEPASRPAGWNEHFDEYSTDGSKLTVVWGQTTRPW